MALTAASAMTLYSEHDADEFDEGTNTLYTEGMRSGIGYNGYDVDIETLYNFNTTVAPPLSMTTDHIGVWLRISNAGAVDTKVNGGMQIAVRDGSGNESYWYVGGSDTYAGGWVFFVAYLGNTPDANNGTVASLTNVADLGVGFKMLAKSADDNCHIDAMYYGTPALTITGTVTTTGEGMQEIFDAVDSAATGLLDKQNGIFLGKGGIQFNDDSTGAVTFSDEGSTFRWADLPVSTTAYKLSLGSSTGISSVTFGSVVGSGDDRQGIAGINMDALGETYEVDFATNLGGNASNSVKLYGCSIKNAQRGLSFDDNGKTTVISNFTNCDEIDQGSTNNGAEILNTFIIDPAGVTNNYGLKFPQTPSVGTLNHNCKQINFITSGTPTTQYMLNFPYTGDYSLDLTNFVMFGNFASGTLWHGINSGTNADITINSLGTTNITQSEFSNTASGTVTVIAGTVTELVNIKNTGAVNIENARVFVETAATIASGEMFEAAVTSLTQSVGTATCTTTAVHGLVTGDKVVVRGAQPDGYNKVATVTVSTTTIFTYSVDSGLSSPATGTPIVSFVVLHGLTDSSGNISATRTWNAAQQLKGWARKKNTVSPFYKDGDIAYTVDTANGNTTNVVLQSDE